MKKRLYSIFGIFTTLLGICNFCSAGSLTFECPSDYSYLGFIPLPLGDSILGDNYVYSFQLSGFTLDFDYGDHINYMYFNNSSDGLYYGTISRSYDLFSLDGTYTYTGFLFGFYLSHLTCDTITITSDAFDGGSSFSDIDVYYNNGNSSTSVSCDGTQAIEIEGLSTITATNTRTPYFNIDYTDEDNQKLTESYSKNILYLSGGLFKKTYTGNNEWILTDTIESSNSSFSGYLPTFEITGGIEEVTESGNIFNNFAENSVKFTLSNIPSYIQYVILLMLLFFILGFIRKFRR